MLGEQGEKGQIDSIGVQEWCINVMRLKASSFEILKNVNPHPDKSKQELSGYVSIDDKATFEALSELCKKEKIDKVVVLYHDYAFSLLGVSFSDDIQPNSIQTDANNTYKFQAKDVHLEALAY